MTVNKRIVLNTIATYGRSMFGVVCGVFSTRWVLEALGQEDFGLYGVVGSMVMFIAFLNIQFASAIGRFYAFVIGKAQIQSESIFALEECRSWFSTGVFIHTFLPLALVLIGYPFGVYAMRQGLLSIPSDRLSDCIWLWRIVCLSTFIGMINVPFQAMYVAKQYIAELTIYSFIQTIVRTALIYYMVCNPGEWLVRYGWIMCLTAVMPQMVISFRALYVFKECRFRFRSAISLSRILQLGSFAFWQGIGGLGFLASHQAMSVLINNYYGACTAGSFSVSQTVSGEAASLTGALQGAFTPAITTMYGAGDMELARKMAFRVCKVGTLLTLMFGLPMAIEIEEILIMWLKDPPPNSAAMCVCTIVFIVIEKLTCGHLVLINASGQVAKSQALRGVLRMSAILMALLAAVLNFSAPIAIVALPISAIIVDIGDVWIARSKVRMGIVEWARHIVIPIAIVTFISLCAGLLPRCFLPISFTRLAISTFITLFVLIVLVWHIVLDGSERIAICNMTRFLMRRRI